MQERKIAENYQDSLFAWRHFGAYMAVMTFSFPFKYIEQLQTYGLKPQSRGKIKVLCAHYSALPSEFKCQLA